MADRTPAEQLDDLAEVDRQGRIGRTTVQVTLPGALIILGSYVARLCGLDLDPGPGVDMPANVVAAWIVVATPALAWLMNRRPSPARID